MGQIIFVNVSEKPVKTYTCFNCNTVSPGPKCWVCEKPIWEVEFEQERKRQEAVRELAERARLARETPGWFDLTPGQRNALVDLAMNGGK